LVQGDVAVIGGLLLAVGVLWALGWELVVLFLPVLRKTGPLEAAASLLCGVILAGFVAMLPSKVAPSEGAFRLIIHWLVPAAVILMSPIIVIPLARAHRGNLPSLPTTGAIRPWLSIIVLAAVTLVVLLHRPVMHPTIELAAARVSDSIRVDVTFAASDGSPYVLTASAPELSEPILYPFVAPASGTMAFTLPTARDLSISLTTPQGQVLRTLFLR
jgi:hypothetical protein